MEVGGQQSTVGFWPTQASERSFLSLILILLAHPYHTLAVFLL